MSFSSGGVCCCVYCAKEEGKMMRCGRCSMNATSRQQAVRYCSKECQVADWREAHKHFCALPVPPKTCEEGMSVYGMLLPRAEDGDKPRVVEVPLEYYEFDDSEGGDSCFLLPNTDKFLWYTKREYYTGISDCRYMNLNRAKGGRRMPHTLVLTFRDDFLGDGSLPNLCVHRITGLPKLPTPWTGPILVTKQFGFPDGPPEDIGLSDGADIVDFFRTFGAPPTSTNDANGGEANVVKGMEKKKGKQFDVDDEQ